MQAQLIVGRARSITCRPSMRSVRHSDSSCMHAELDRCAWRDSVVCAMCIIHFIHLGLINCQFCLIRSVKCLLWTVEVTTRTKTCKEHCRYCCVCHFVFANNHGHLTFLSLYVRQYFCCLRWLHWHNHKKHQHCTSLLVINKFV
jgi:hypothetical protein